MGVGLLRGIDPKNKKGTWSVGFVSEPATRFVVLAGATPLGLLQRRQKGKRDASPRVVQLLTLKTQRARSPHDSGRFISW
jgi:hypothetical protein